MGEVDTSYGWAPGFEIGYDQITANVTITSTTESSGTVVVSASAHAFDGGPVIAEFFSPLVEADQSGIGDVLVLSLFEGSVQIGEIAEVRAVVTANRALYPTCAKLRFSPSAGLHTYSVTGFATANNGATVFAGAGGTGTLVPAYLRFTKV